MNNIVYPKENEKKKSETIQELKSRIRHLEKHVKYLENQLSNYEKNKSKTIKNKTTQTKIPKKTEVVDSDWKKNFVKQFKEDLKGKK